MASHVKKAKMKLALDSVLSVISKILGILLLFISIVFIIAAITDDKLQDDTSLFYTFLVFFILLGVASVIMLRWGSRTKKLTNLFRNYVHIISAGSNGQLGYIANVVGKSEDVVAKNISRMINKKYFVNAYLDQSRGELIIAGQSLKQTSLSHAMSTTCRGCGAISRSIIGADTHCEYCGSPL